MLVSRVVTVCIHASMNVSSNFMPLVSLVYVYACDLITLATTKESDGNRDSVHWKPERTTALKLLTYSYKDTIFQRGRQLRWFGLVLSTHMVAGGKIYPVTYTWNI